jgi:ABC-type transporter Mla maintaining outer membrane lipid asymmetry permease subunit MlaE
MVRKIQEQIEKLQEFSLMVLDTLRASPTVLRNRKELLEQMYLVGAQAFIIVFLAGLFIGIVMTIETGHRLETFGAKLLVGRTVARDGEGIRAGHYGVDTRSENRSKERFGTRLNAG